MKINLAVIVIGLMASLLSAFPLLDLRSGFAGDWVTHLWIIEYFGECIKHFSLPEMINTQSLVGIPNALFYSQKFYTFCGVLSAFWGSAITVRILVIAVFLLQFLHVFRAAIKFGSSQITSISIAVMVTWTTYPIANLYTRGDITEFFAFCFLNCSVTSLLCLFHDKGENVPAYDYIAIGLFYTLAALTHPLTGYYGGMILMLLGVIVLLFCRNNRKLKLMSYFLMTVLFILLILSPWFYILYQFHDKIPISSSKYSIFSNTVANILCRLSPYPYTFLIKGVAAGTAPDLDPQINVPLILLIFAFLYIGRRGRNIKLSLNTGERIIIGALFLIFLLAFMVSVNPEIPTWLRKFFDILQLYYRLINYMNLSSLAILIIVAGRISRANANSKKLVNVFLAFCVGVSFFTFAEKLKQSFSDKYVVKTSDEAWAPLPWGDKKHLNELPDSFIAYWDYRISNWNGFTKDSMSDLFPKDSLNFNVLEGNRFGEVEPLTITLSQPTFLVTNVFAFPWNQIVCFNGPVSQKIEIIVNDINRHVSILLFPGTYHLKYVMYDDVIWHYLNNLSWVLLIVWIFLYFGFIFHRMSVKKKK